MLCIICRESFNNLDNLFKHTCKEEIKPYLDELPEEEQDKIYSKYDKNDKNP